MDTRVHVVSLGLCLVALSGIANSNTELGTVTPGAPYDAGTQQTFLAGLLTAYNHGITGSWNVPGAPGGGNYTYTVNPGSSLTGVAAPTLNGLSVLGNMSGISGSTSVTLSLVGMLGVDYITIKWGQDFEAYYVRGLTGSVTLGNDVNHNGISAYTFMNGRNVPDGGTTVGLMGLGLGALWWFARARKFA